MKKYIFFLMGAVCFLLSSSAVHANELNKSDANIIGHVLDKNTEEHLSFISVSLKGTTIGTMTDASGHYFLKNLPEGEFTMEVSAVGYKTVSRKVTLRKGKTLEENFEIEEDLIALDGVVVSANRSETTRRMAPTLVNVMDVKVFENTNSSTLSQGLNFQPGVRVENNCQNCGFQQVRINGLDGPYTQILIDSRPIFSALAGVYGLEQIPANMIERVEVMRGGGSALFGSSAIAGTINIITKEPVRNSGQLTHTLTGIGGTSSWDNNTTLNLSAGLVHGILQMIFGISGATAGAGFKWYQVVLCALLDYLVAFGVLGLSGVFKKSIKNPQASFALGALFACVLKYISHFFSGYILFGGWAEWFFTEGGGMSYGSKILSSYSGNVLSAVYSVIYNATFSIPETVLSLVMVVVLISIKPIRKAAGIK